VRCDCLRPPVFRLRCWGADRHYPPLDFSETKALKDVGVPIPALEVSLCSSVFHADGAHKNFWFDAVTLFLIWTASVPHPFVMPITDKTFLIGSACTMIVTGKHARRRQR
jgi:hypothetical protein